LSTIVIRPARLEDAATVVDLVRELAVYERMPPTAVKLTEADPRRDGFGATPRFEILLAELDGRVDGFALFFHNYSTWEGRAGLFIEDLFVRASARGRGLGRGLLAAMARVARERGCPRIDLNVLHWNPTREFYHRIGCEHLAEWLPYRMTAPTIMRLAAEADGAI
jgi:GNAT superfamily N-acetyltransferase